MRRADLLAAAGAGFLWIVQIGAGGLWPFGPGEDERRLEASALEIDALAAAREVERAESEWMRAYLEEAAASSFDRDSVGGAWVDRLSSGSGAVEWGPGPERGTYRLQVRGSLERILEVLGDLDASPGTFRVERLELVPEGRAARALVLLRDTMGGD
ncbi:MAG: hypothetical protein EHM19_05135 [Candidatus Latescibacterota bacterium]|nr:MAG: hypothetical protein EHM19_05135 [Candidatus Latescibacterota bacterium]